MSGAAGPPGAAHGRFSRTAAWTLLAASLAAVLFVRLRLLEIPLERDEGEYAYGGQLLLRGEAIYAHLYTMKLPGTHAAYALGMAVFGQTIAGVHLTFLLWNLAAVALVGLVGRSLGGATTGILAAAAYAVMTVSPGVLGTSAHATHFVVVPALGGLLLLGRALDRDSATLLLLAGLVSGLAPVMKQAGAALVLVGAAWFLVAEARRRPRDPGRLIARLATFSAGVLLPFVATCVLVQNSGAFETFWFWTVDYGRAYASEVSLADGIDRLEATAARVLEPAALLWALAASGVLLPVFDAPSRRGAVLRTGLLVAGFLAACPGLWFRPHYFVLVLPAAAILAAAAIVAAMDGLERRGAVARSLPIVAFAAGLAQPFLADMRVLFELPPRHASREMYVTEANPFPEAMDVAAFLNANARPEDAIAVVASEPEIYFYTRRTAPTGYVYTYPLVEKQPYATRMAKEMEEEITAAAPAFIVAVPEREQTFLEGPGYGGQYELIGVVETPRDGSPSAYWFDDVRDHAPSTPYWVAVYRRKLPPR